MITGELKSKIDAVWNRFRSGGISNPLEVIEQITYLLFMRRLDDLQTAKEQRARFVGNGVIDNPVFLPEQQHLRWSRLKTLDDAQEMYETVSNEVFPFLRTLGGDESTYSHHMANARFTIPTPQLLDRVVHLVDELPLQNRDTNGDLYEYLLSKLNSAGQNGQFRTPRHIIQLMVEMTAPTPDDRICDPACGTAGFLVAASEYVRTHSSEVMTDAAAREKYHHRMFHGYDFDSTMLRIGSMNMLLHGVEGPDIRYRDSLAEGANEDSGQYSLILANPPFSGSLDYETTSNKLLKTVKTKKTELLFLALFLDLLDIGGRAAVIVPDGVLFGSSTAHRTLRRMLVEEEQLEAVVKLPSGVFKPYAGVSTAILFFRRTGGAGGTDNVWFYDAKADGMSLDDKRQELLPSTKLGPVPSEALTEDEHAKNNLPDVLARWNDRDGAERDRARTEQSFCVSKQEIVDAGYDLAINRYQEIALVEEDHRDPLDIIAELEKLDDEIRTGLAELKEMLR
ncbi:type I restriction-modification system subunit M [Kocuria sp. LUK]|uniref:type I restriction-modification system subunit M n=1 Tax=Kocuria sp. LUK TaxID=2897828 RepID=UPI001E49A5D2|nr:class I SAM-dependent DNA methyltransferase [Kocuria sp. LUK]MCD1144431.1 type I restriction-modification system subunit M [Kocuria sp. LUK]